MRGRNPVSQFRDGLVVVATALLIAAPAYAAEPAATVSGKAKAEKQAAVSDEIIVRFQKDASAAAERDAVSAAGAEFVERVGQKLVDAAVVKVESNNKAEVMKALEDQGAIKYAHPNSIVSAYQAPSDSLFSEMWNLSNEGNAGTYDADIDAPEAWDYNTGSCSITVAIADTGIDTTHPDLGTNLWVNPGEVGGNGRDDDGNGIVDDVNGANFVTGSGNPYDDHGHGTHVAGTIGAVGFNQEGVIGISPRVRLMGLKFLDEDGFGTTADAISAIEYANSKGVNVINASWGGGGYEQALGDAIAATSAVFVAASGNSGMNNDVYPSYPASFDLPNVISVGASDSNDSLASYSNYGQSVDLAAPGSDILSTVPGGYSSFSGTSMAAPHVSGAAALLLASNPSASPSTVRSVLMSSSDVTSGISGLVASGGRLNINSALNTLGGARDSSTTLCDGSNMPVDDSDDDLRPDKFKLKSPTAGKTYYTGKKKKRSRLIAVKWTRSKDPDGIRSYKVKLNGHTIKTLKDPDGMPQGRKPKTETKIKVSGGKRKAKKYRIYIVATDYQGFSRKSIVSTARRNKSKSARRSGANDLGQLFKVKAGKRTKK